MPRILILIVLIYVLYFLAKRFLASVIQKNKPTEPADNNVANNMVECALCHTHIPESESANIDNQMVCKSQPCQSAE